MDYTHKIDGEEEQRIKRFLYVVAISTVAFVVLVAVAIMTADRWLLMISAESEQRFIEPYLELADGTLLEPGNAELQVYVAGLASKVAGEMALSAELELTFQVIKSDSVNAFTTLGGYIFVTESLVQALHSENSLAMVLGHEIAHARQRDPLLSTGRGMLIGLLLSTLSGSGGNSASIGDLSSQLMLNIYSREQEQTADYLALAAVYEVYGHVGGATELFEVVAADSETVESLEVLSSHPKLVDRIDYLNKTAAEQGWLQEPVSPYPANIVEVLKTL